MAAAAQSPPVPAISAPTTKVSSPKAADEVEQEQMHVLAVDDSNVDRAVISKILRSSKYRGKYRSMIGWVDSAAEFDREMEANKLSSYSCSDRSGFGNTGSGAPLPRPAP